MRRYSLFRHNSHEPTCKCAVTVNEARYEARGTFFFFYFSLPHSCHISLPVYLLRAHTPPPPPPDDFMNDDIDSYLIAMDTSVAPGSSATGPPTPPLADSICLKQTAAASHRTRIHSEEEDKTTDSGRPPNKKVWFSFHINTSTY